jgi:glucokinase
LAINEKGPYCNCGAVGCLEAYVGNKRILTEARKKFKRGITLEELSGLAERHNKMAVEIWRKTGAHLGFALAGGVNLLNLDAIVIGGGVAKAGNALFDSINKTLKVQAMSVQAKRVRILKAKLGNEAGLIGAAIMVKEGL